MYSIQSICLYFICIMLHVYIYIYMYARESWFMKSYIEAVVCLLCGGVFPGVWCLLLHVSWKNCLCVGKQCSVSSLDVYKWDRCRVCSFAALAQVQQQRPRMSKSSMFTGLVKRLVLYRVPTFKERDMNEVLSEQTVLPASFSQPWRTTMIRQQVCFSEKCANVIYVF